MFCKDVLFCPEGLKATYLRWILFISWAIFSLFSFVFSHVESHHSIECFKRWTWTISFHHMCWLLKNEFCWHVWTLQSEIEWARPRNWQDMTEERWGRDQKSDKPEITITKKKKKKSTKSNAVGPRNENRLLSDCFF